MSKINCWEFKKCGREPGGEHAGSKGVCPAALDETSEGTNSGKCAGRICWSIAGTFCDGIVQGDYAKKEVSCISCNFFLLVREEEGINIILLRPSQTLSDNSHND
ncbi:MAG: hypothetical protein ISR96_08935 [Nitrospira sp.]|nr:hypothetical protein [bacterium]MBL7049624.1 hypothetical protein [Nitrospira sp.]